MDFLDNLLSQLLTIIPKKHKKLVTKSNVILIILLITSIYIYQKKPKALVGFLVHPFSQVILLGLSAYYLSSKKLHYCYRYRFYFYDFNPN